MAPGYMPAPRPARFTPVKVATPLASVVAVPTVRTVPPSLRVKLTVLPASGEALAVRVHASVAVPPTVPSPETADRFVGRACEVK